MLHKTPFDAKIDAKIKEMQKIYGTTPKFKPKPPSSKPPHSKLHLKYLKNPPSFSFLSQSSSSPSSSSPFSTTSLSSPSSSSTYLSSPSSSSTFSSSPSSSSPFSTTSSSSTYSSSPSLDNEYNDSLNHQNYTEDSLNHQNYTEDINYKLPSLSGNCNRSIRNEYPGCQTYSCKKNNIYSYSYDCDWKQYYDTEAHANYYFNEQTGEAKWVKPDYLYINGGLKKHIKSKKLSKKKSKKSKKNRINKK